MNVDVWEFPELVHIIEEYKAYKRAMQRGLTRQVAVSSEQVREQPGPGATERFEG